LTDGGNINMLTPNGSAINMNQAGVTNTGDLNSQDIVASGQIISTAASNPPFRGAQQTKTSGSNGAAGDIAWDANYIYVCTASNTWKRVALSTF
jgi:hypothetical protein